MWEGLSGIGVLEDAIREQHFERIIALLEQGFSPNGERGSSKVGCVFESLAPLNACYRKIDSSQYSYPVLSFNRILLVPNTFPSCHFDR